MVLEARDVRLEFGDSLECRGKVASYLMKDYLGITPILPDLTHCTMGWDVCSDETPYERHIELLRMKGGPTPGSNSLTRSERWKDARAVVEIHHPGSCFVSIAGPRGEGLASYLTPFFSEGGRLLISLNVGFAAAEGVEWPTVQGFLERGEPLFATDQPKFLVYSSDHPDFSDDEPLPEGILRHGNLWLRPRAK